jgi:hypothetical protein
MDVTRPVFARSDTGSVPLHMIAGMQKRIVQLGAALLLAALVAGSAAINAAASQLTAQTPDSANWLDQPLVGWNQAGMPLPVPVPPTGYALNPSCAPTLRWAETPQDQALVDAGWSLQAPYQAGWGMIVVDGASSYDGMCRPLGYNAFVFVNGVFVGTISPDPMDSRTTGAGMVTSMQNGQVFARYVRYAPADPLCCPSEPAVDVTFEVQSTPAGPVLVPVSKYVEGTP